MKPNLKSHMKVLAGLLVALVLISAEAHEVEVHKALTEFALQRADLVRSQRLAELGLDEVMRFPTTSQSRTFVEAVQLGAEREDCCLRPVNHFFDVQHNGRGLTIGFLQVGFPSPTWALEDEQTVQQQAWSYRDANSSFYKALTSGTSERDKQWGRTFESLGHVVHHIQDMTQPEHTRNDQHLVGVDTSYFEARTKELFESGELGSAFDSYPKPTFRRAREYWASGEGATGLGVAQFTSSNFVSKDTNFAHRDGVLAANDRFSLPAPSLVTNESSLKDLLGESIGSQDVGATCAQLLASLPADVPHPNDCTIEFIGNQVVDRLAGTSSNNLRASAFSVFDETVKRFDLKVLRSATEHPEDRVPSLNRFTHQAALPFLLPHAVAYSAGLIDHFFRGRLDARDVALSGDVVTVELVNLSADDSTLADGTVEIWYDAADGSRRQVAVVSGNAVVTGLADAESLTLTFIQPADVARIGKPYVAVFRGTIGEEAGVAGIVFGVPLEGFMLQSSTTPPDGIGGRRLLTSDGAGWTLFPEAGGEAGNVDWKGRYVDGRATKVLTWHGLPTRYMPMLDSPLGYFVQRGPQYFQSKIFERGELLAETPAPVLGAALNRDASGNDWIVAVVNDGQNDIVVRKPYRSDKSPGWYDSASAPNGWQRLLSMPMALGEGEFASSHWLFNGSGTEAQTIRLNFNTYPMQSAFVWHRRMTRISGAFASMEELSLGAGETSHSETIGTCQTYTSTVSNSGNSVAAVDYRDDQEVVAVRRLQGQTDSTVSRFSSQSQSSFNEWLEAPGFESVTLLGSSYTAGRSGNFGNIYSVDSRSDSFIVQTFDLRTGVVIGARSTRTKSFTSKPSGSNWVLVGDGVNSTSLAYQLRQAQAGPTINLGNWSTTASLTQTDLKPSPFPSCPDPNAPRNSSSTTTKPPSGLGWNSGTFFSGGSRVPENGPVSAVDRSGRVLYYQEVPEGSTGRRQLHHLDGGDLRALYGDPNVEIGTAGLR